jgi:hypothetical protein
MIYLAPSVGPRERLEILETSARAQSQRDDVREIVRRVRAGFPSPPTQTQLARALLALVSAPVYQGSPSEDASDGQWIDENVSATVEGGGDCVDRTHAMLALAYAAGLDGFPVWLTEPEPAPLDHVAARLLSDGLWHWADAFQRPAVLGVAPRGVAMRDARGLVG